MPFAIGERYAGFAASGDEFPVPQADRVRQIARARDDFAASPAAIGGGSPRSTWKTRRALKLRCRAHEHGVRFDRVVREIVDV
jgi:hypothetical protein